MDSTKRFSNRVEYYLKYRPRYPEAVLGFLQEELAFNRQSRVADIGSGTGFSSELFLKNGNTVFGVEPNPEMRTVAQAYLRDFPNFISIEGTAESTTLSDDSVDLIVAGQSFHWFDIARSRDEFRRILEPGGCVLLMWNDRRIASTAFSQQYERILRRFGTDYTTVDHKNVDRSVLARFFGHQTFQTTAFDYQQVFDFEGLKGRLLSCSYIPMEGHPKYDPMMKELEMLFIRHESGGTVILEYDTRIYLGSLE